MQSTVFALAGALSDADGRRESQSVGAELREKMSLEVMISDTLLVRPSSKRFGPLC